MGYRRSNEPPKPENMLRKFDVRNGAKMRITFGCYYAERGHDPKVHDYLGWPTPDHPDDICQIQPYPGWRFWHPFPYSNRPIHMEPIHLIEEGYDPIPVVTFEDPEIAEHLTVDTWIDEFDDNLIHMNVEADFPTFKDQPIETRFTIFISKEDGSAIDAVCHAYVTVLPGSPFKMVLPGSPLKMVLPGSPFKIQGE